MSLQAIGQLAMRNQKKLFVDLMGWQRSHRSYKDSEYANVEKCPSACFAQTEWNAKYMTMIQSGFVIQYLAEESKLTVWKKIDELQAGELCALLTPNINCVLIKIRAH